MIRYTTSIDGVEPADLAGFFVGWPNPPSSETHLRILHASSVAALALDGRRVIGFCTAIADGVLSASVPLLEVLPEYGGQGVGTELMRIVLDQLGDLYMIDLTCDPPLQPFYARLGMQASHGMVLRNYGAQSGRGDAPTESNNDVKIAGPRLGLAALCEPIIRALPQWFAIPSAVERYLRQIDELPTFTAQRDDRVVGFITVQRCSSHAAQIVVMGVEPEHHRTGIGRRLIEAAERYLIGVGVEYAQVLTLGPSHPDAGYSQTRAFYEAMGYRGLQERSDIWGADNPCLIMVRYLAASRRSEK